MLTTLRISGFAIVDAIEVRFGPGLNVLTGETGAGKSILVNALHLVLGGRMSGEVLRDGADEAVVEALFELPRSHSVFARLESAALSLEILRGVHSRWAALLDSLPESAWTRKGLHLRRGEMTLEDLLALYARHGENHVRQITDLRAARGW